MKKRKTKPEQLDILKLIESGKLDGKKLFITSGSKMSGPVCAHCGKTNITLSQLMLIPDGEDPDAEFTVALIGRVCAKKLGLIK